MIDVIREENTEDMLKMAGTGDVNIASKSIFKNTRARLPWLLASFVGGLIAVYVIGIFEVQLDRLAALAAFIPIIIGMEATSVPSHRQSSFVGLRQGRLTSRRRGKFCGERLQPVLHSGVFRESCFAPLLNFGFRK